ncbi:MAG: glycoside hydrolase family 2 protein [Propionicimonas sp.]|uniref:glycoside hydrolase family 2 protein n=1 Tax=Propionicimonas sp. TaxID=1955623 RepID=UPI002B1EB0B3|nr:glycoside hydrolase family 2 protein [Propionicimonas sp.]MEA4944758.1 glycoside hydrolase family 2 protein [Propionicimonas sp.]
MGRTRLELSGTRWTLRAIPGTAAWQQVPPAARDRLAAGIAATVPGCVHTDLLAAGLIDDPYPGTSEADQHWVGAQTWCYRHEFELAPDSDLLAGHCDLVCLGLDTVADVTLNGTPLGSTANMHRRYAFAAGEALRPGGNLLEIGFAPALEYIARMQQLVGERHHVEADPYNLIRKMACNFGWDWGPRLITAGIWKPLALVGWQRARLADLSVLATAEPADGAWQGRLRVAARTAGDAGGAQLTVTVSGRGADATVTVPAEPAPDGWTSAELDLPVQPWWPHSLGDQPLYEVEVVLHDGDTVLDRESRRTGFRSTVLDTTEDADGTGATFGLVINGVEVFVRGANWIPDDAFVTRVTPQRYRERIQQARDAHVDLLRVWGGGLYETDEFYAACDELGMLVWQDFALACSPYPEEEPFWSQFEAEARDNVVRLSAHPSLVIWNGNNEASWGHQEWGWDELPGGDLSWGGGYYDELFPRIVAELDPSRPYWPGSPSSGSPELRANDPDRGTIHVWDVWNERDYTGYGDYAPRFVAEFGYQGPATFATWARTLAPADRSASSAAMLVHQKAKDGNLKLRNGIRGHLPEPGEGVDDFDDWLFAMQLQQARAVRFGIERWRSLRGRCRGSILWQLNDCWPVTSWSMLDLGTDATGAPVARRKPLWYAVRSAYADRLVTLQRRADGWTAVLVNDGTGDWPAEGVLDLRRLSGEVLWSQAVSAVVRVRSKLDIAVRLDPAGLPVADLALVATIAGAERTVALLTEDVAAALPEPGYQAYATADADGATVTVRATSFLRSLCLFPDRVAENAEVDSLLIDLFPGETHSFGVRGLAGADPDGLLVPTVLRSVRLA